MDRATGDQRFWKAQMPDAEAAGGTLRPLRDPDSAGLDDDEDGAED
ncbi:hypothetical protein ACWD25_29635 [Streptomyces sp. NPDC002920]